MMAAQKNPGLVFFLFNLFWLLIFVLLTVFSHYSERDNALAMASLSAKSSFNKDVIYRRWAAQHGGLYVPETIDSPANPYLENTPERDLVTPSGRHLTLVNPAYMSRQVNEMAGLSSNSAGHIPSHITSLDPLRPENRPDPWEEKALKMFGPERMEFSEIIDRPGKSPLLRYMRALLVEKSCLKCHGQQGYRSGQIRGGISVSLDLKPYFDNAETREFKQILTFFLIWLSGAVFFNLLLLRLHRELKIRILTETRLRQAQERFEMAEEGASQGLWDWPDVNRNKVWWSKQFYDLLGYDDEEIPSTLQGFNGLIHAEDRARIRSAVEKHFSEHGPFVQELRLRRKDGNFAWFRIKGQTTWDELDRPLRMSGSIENVTERKQVEEKFEKAFSNRLLIMTICDLDNGVILNANDKFLRVTGYKRDEVIGRTEVEIGLLSQDQYQKMSDELATKGQVNQIELQLSGKHADKIDCFLFCEPISIGNSRQKLTIAQDLRVIKKARQDRETLRKQLLQAQKLEAVGTLAGGIAHDFKNILSAILGYTEMTIMSHEDDLQLCADLDNVVRAVQRAQDLITQILAFSRQSAGIDKKPLRLQPVVREALKMLRSTLPSDIEIKEDIDPAGGMVLADASQIHQVLVNLCTNSFHAMENHGGVLTVSLHANAAPSETGLTANHDQFIRISVRDTGCGISRAIQEKIFDPFFTTKTQDKGSGMGLATSYGIIREHSGLITVESEPGQGACFNVYLPAISQEWSPQERDEPAPMETLPRGSEKILLVDDDEMAVDSLAVILERLGYDVKVHYDSQAAWSVLQNPEPACDLLITDMTMPGMSGLELARKVHEQHPGLPIILYTGYNISDSEELTDTGISRIFSKPAKTSLVARTVRELLD